MMLYTTRPTYQSRVIPPRFVVKKISSDTNASSSTLAAHVEGISDLALDTS